MPDARIQDHQIHSVRLNSIRDEIAAARGDKPTLAERPAALSAGGGGIDLGQVTKLNITASQKSPYIVDITITETQDFRRLPVEVLKFTPGEQDKITTICEFNNADATSFQGPTRRWSSTGLCTLRRSIRKTWSMAVPRV